VPETSHQKEGAIAIVPAHGMILLYFGMDKQIKVQSRDILSGSVLTIPGMSDRGQPHTGGRASSAQKNTSIFPALYTSPFMSYHKRTQKLIPTV
jgi:hypothetical protein